MGQIFRVSLYGSSHGPCIGVLIEGCPSGISLELKDFTEALYRRKSGIEGTTTRIEDDMPDIQAGVYKGKTTGLPINIVFANKNVQSKDYDFDGFFRPGHADFTNNQKYHGFNDPRGGGQSSGRMTVALVAAGVVASKVLQTVNIEANLIEAGGQKNVKLAVEKAIQNKDSIGGVINCKVDNLPIAWGEPFFNSVESLISHAVFSIPGVKAIGFGAGVDVASSTGKQNNDVFVDKKGSTLTNNSGGVNGGLTNGNALVFKTYIKPTSSITSSQNTFNFERNKMDDLSIKGRHDVCFALRVPPIIEAVTAIVLADLKLVQRTQSIEK